MFAIAQELSVHISERKQTVKERGSIIFTCTISNPVPGGEVTWEYFRHTTGKSEFYSTETLLPRIQVTENVNSDMGNVSSLSIFNATSDDSGLTSCRYTYYDTVTNEMMVIQSVGSVCVTSRPESPLCLINHKNMSEVVCTAMGVVCPDDITLRWFDNDTMKELSGLTSVHGMSGENVDNVLATTSETNTYICKLESIAYEDVHHTCSFKQMLKPSHEQTTNEMFTTSRPIQATSIPSSASYFETTTSTSTSPFSNISFSFATRNTTLDMHSTTKGATVMGFTRTFIIIVGFVGAGGMFLLFIIVVVIVTVCKRLCHQRPSDAEFVVKFERNNTNIQPRSEDTKQDQSNDHGYTETTGTDEIPIYSKPIKNKPVLEGSSNQAVEPETSFAVPKPSSVKEGAGSDHYLNKSTGIEQTQMYSTLNEVDNQTEQSDTKYTHVSGENKEMLSESDTSAGDHASPALNMAGSNRDSNPYASVQDTDRPKMELPQHESANEYAYAYTGLKMRDPNLGITNADSRDDGEVEGVNGPHYFVLEKDSDQNDKDQNKGIPVHDKLNEKGTVDLKSDENQEIRNESDQEDVPKSPKSPHEYAYASFGPDGKPVLHISAKNETMTTEDDDDDDGGIMIENSIYEQ